MQVYLVGGAVRDELLGRPVHERDWVVVGATPERMQQDGYRAVGREFPVFLHPKTKEEYALARLERKTGRGYHGFATYSAPDVTLEQDLQRRDLTINALARAPDGTLIDPYGGARDIELRVLRHVSRAFVEDPVRILRVARFAARFAALGFKVAPETEELMREMVRAGEADALQPERVWREMERALGEASPEVFLDVLAHCNALPIVLPELSWTQVERATLERAAQCSHESMVRFAALLATTAPDDVFALCERLRTPAEFRDLARLAATFAARLIPDTEHLTASSLLAIFEKADALRRRERFERLLLVAGAVGKVDTRLPAALNAIGEAVLSDEERSGLKGPQIAAALRERRLQRLRSLYGA